MGAPRPLSIGMDYGTSHCSAGHADGNGVRLLPMGEGRTLVASLLWAPSVSFELGFDAQGCIRSDDARFQALAFGDDALQRYLDAPERGYYVKSPKSFLGAPGLLPQVRERFVRLVGAMMLNVRLHAEEALGQSVTAAVVGRPVNFQGPQGSVENDTALAMLTQAATLAGFEAVDFLFEPLAAALEYEARLNAEQRVLVVDIGGGTTDCSFVIVGPDRSARLDRGQDVLGHSGERLGGNDYDQALALLAAVPELGWQAERRRGLPVPNHYFVDAISINDVNAQARFYGASTGERLEVLAQELRDPGPFERFLRLRDQRGSYRLLRGIEQAKIGLSEAAETSLNLGYLEPSLTIPVTRDALLAASETLLEHLASSVSEALAQGESAPDVVYLTGGMAQSPIVRDHLNRLLDGLPVLDSDHFASVTEGLSLHAARRFAA
ncbi:MAG: molecular chaperone [Pseudomonadota bacterium]